MWRLLFFLLIMSFASQKLLSFMRYNSSIVDFRACAILFMFWTWSPVKWVQAYSPISVLLDSVYSVLCCMLWCIWTWVLCRMIDMDLLLFSTCRHQISPAPFVEDALIFSTACSCLFYQNGVSIDLFGYVSIFHYQYLDVYNIIIIIMIIIIIIIL